MVGPRMRRWEEEQGGRPVSRPSDARDWQYGMHGDLYANSELFDQVKIKLIGKIRLHWNGMSR